jgi:hypothetical protein
LENSIQNLINSNDILALINDLMDTAQVLKHVLTDTTNNTPTYFDFLKSLSGSLEHKKHKQNANKLPHKLIHLIIYLCFV